MKFRTLLRLPLLDRMVATELFKTLGAVLLVLVTIIVTRKFLGILAKAIEGEVAGETLFTLLGLKMLSASAQLLPAATFISILTVLGRMYRDQEMAILSAAGVGVARMYRAVSWAAVPLVLIGAVMALVVMPWSERQVQALLAKDEQSADIRGIKEGRFNEFSQGDVVLYTESIDEKNVMHQVFVQSRQGKEVGVVIASSGRLVKNDMKENFIALNEGRRYQGTPGRVDFVISEFGEYGVRIDAPEDDAGITKRAATESLLLLKSREPKEMAELQKRFAIPLGIFFLITLAMPLSRMAPRAGVYGNVFNAFLVFVIYENAQKISMGLLMTGKIPAWLSYSAVYLGLSILTIVLLARNLGAGWLFGGARRFARG